MTLLYSPVPFAQQNPVERRAYWRAKQRALRERHPEQMKAYMKKFQRDMRDYLLSALAMYKLEHGCADCGDRWQASAGEIAEALEFDHARGPGRRHGGRQPSQIQSYHKALEELEVCDVVCAICHNVRTMERRHDSR